MKTKSTLFCLVFAVWANTSITAYAQAVNKQDSLALVDLYNSTDGPNWFDNSGWLSGPVPTWYGVEVTGKRVTSIILYRNNLNGAIPFSIGNLVSLANLDLFENQLSGSIPSSLGNLVNLGYLSLSNNQLSGTIPSSLGKLVNLAGLYLNNNQLSGSIPSSLGNLTNLLDLLLYDNQLSGTIPSSLGSLLNLQGLELSNNQLSGNVPSSLLNLVNLSFLSLNNNQLSGTIPSYIGKLVSLGLLRLNNNQLSGTIPSSLGNLLNLYYLDLSTNHLSGTIPSSLGKLDLGDLYLNNNQLSGTIPTTAQTLRSRLSRYLSPPLFPVLFRDLPCKLIFHEIGNSEFEINHFKIMSGYVLHPGPTIGFRITGHHSVFTYIPDHEPALGRNGMINDSKWISAFDLASGADLLYHDGQHTNAEYQSRKGWGHSSVEDALLFATLCRVKKLLIAHHDPAHSDEDLDKILINLQTKHQYLFSYEMAEEGTTYHLA